MRFIRIDTFPSCNFAYSNYYPKKNKHCAYQMVILHGPLKRAYLVIFFRKIFQRHGCIHFSTGKLQKISIFVIHINMNGRRICPLH